MIKNLRKRFIIFSVCIIGTIIVILGLLVYIGPSSNLSIQKLSETIILSIGMVFAGSWLLSGAAIKPIKYAWQKQLDFTADASHELRTPITVIQTNLELVMDNPKKTVKSQIKWLQNIEAENKRMAMLVDHLLTLSRADTNQQTLEKTTFTLNEAISEALIPFEPVADQKGIVLNTHLDKQTVFYGDRQRIKQLVVILVDNAFNYMDCTGNVTISLDRNKKELNLTVSDTGYGIENEHLDKIFDRFYRIAKTRNLNQDGSGLGLSIAKWIVQEHKGTIHVESTLGKGTQFFITLPNLIHCSTNYQ